MMQRSSLAALGGSASQRLFAGAAAGCLLSAATNQQPLLLLMAKRGFSSNKQHHEANSPSNTSTSATTGGGASTTKAETNSSQHSKDSSCTWNSSGHYSQQQGSQGGGCWYRRAQEEWRKHQPYFEKCMKEHETKMKENMEKNGKNNNCDSYGWGKNHHHHHHRHYSKGWSSCSWAGGASGCRSLKWYSSPGNFIFAVATLPFRVAFFTLAVTFRILWWCAVLYCSFWLFCKIFGLETHSHRRHCNYSYHIRGEDAEGGPSSYRACWRLNCADCLDDSTTTPASTNNEPYIIPNPKKIPVQWV